MRAQVCLRALLSFFHTHTHVRALTVVKEEGGVVDEQHDEANKAILACAVNDGLFALGILQKGRQQQRAKKVCDGQSSVEWKRGGSRTKTTTEGKGRGGAGCAPAT